MSESEMLAAICKRNEAFETWIQQSSPDAQSALRKARTDLRATKRDAIQKWAHQKAQGCSAAELKADPKKVWRTVKELQAGLTGHHAPLQEMQMKKSNGTMALTDEENADIFGPHFKFLFNRDDAPVDHTVLGLIIQIEAIESTGAPPTIDEVKIAIAKMINGKSPGEDGVTVAALKALPDCSMVLL